MLSKLWMMLVGIRLALVITVVRVEAFGRGGSSGLLSRTPTAPSPNDPERPTPQPIPRRALPFVPLAIWLWGRNGWLWQALW